MKNVPEFLKKYRGKRSYTHRVDDVLVSLPRDVDDCGEAFVGHIRYGTSLQDDLLTVHESRIIADEIDLVDEKTRQCFTEALDVAVAIHEWMNEQADEAAPADS